MTEHEKQLIEIIRNSSDPQKALVIAINVITDYLASKRNGDEDE